MRAVRASFMTRFFSALLLSWGGSGCWGVWTDIDLDRHFNTGYGYVQFRNGLASPTGRANNLKFQFPFAFHIDSRGRYVMGLRERNASNMPEAMFIRYLPTGSVDTSFGTGNGWVMPNGNLPALATGDPANSKNENLIDALSSDTSGRYYVNFVSGADGSGVLASVLMRLSEDGSIDTSFGGGDGYALLNPSGSALAGGTGEAVGFTYVPALDQLIGLGASANGSTGADEAVAVRLNSSGTLDTSFGTSGGYSIFQHDGNGLTGLPNATKNEDALVAKWVRNSRGEIFGQSASSSDTNGAAGGYTLTHYKLTSAGIYDTSYGPYGNGVAEIPQHGLDGIAGETFASKYDYAPVGAITIDSRGRIYMAGSSQTLAAAGARGFVVRWNTSGHLDSSFGTGGIVLVNGTGASLAGYGIAANINETILGVDYDAITDKVVAVGSSGDSTNTRGLILRLNMDGSLDSTFGSGGYTVLLPPDRPTESFAGAAPANVGENCTHVEVDVFGRYVVACISTNAAGGLEPVVVRVTTEGEINS